MNVVVNVIFLIAYVALSPIVPGEVLNAVSVLHCVVFLFLALKFQQKLSPLMVYYLCVILTSTSNILLISDYHSHRISVYTYFISLNSDQASLIWCVGNTFLYLGYDFFSKRSMAPIDVSITTDKGLNILYWVMLVLVFRGFVFDDSAFSSFGKLLDITSSMGVIFFARLWGMTDSKRYRYYALSLCISLTIYAILYSYLRLTFILPTLSLFVGYYIGKSNIKDLLSPKIIPYIFCAFVFSKLFSFWGDHRDDAGVGAERIDLFTAPDDKALMEERKDENVEEKSGSFFGRMANLAQLTNIVQLVEKKGFYNGTASEPLLVSLIPRFLWPEKPKIALGAWFAVEIGQGMKTEDWFNNSINMTIPGELYLDFGWVGVAIGCLFIGALLSLLWNATNFNESPYNITGVLFGGYLLISSVTGIGADLQIVITFISTYTLFWAFKKLT